MYKFCHYLTKPIITRIIVSLMFKNVIIRIEVTVFRDFITLVKYVQILSLFNQAHYYTNYFVFKGRVYLKNLRFLKISFFDLMNALPLLLGWEKGFSLIWAFSAV